MYGGDGWMWHGGWGWGGWVLMGVVMLVFWALVITLVIVAVRYLTADRSTRPPPPAARPSAEDLLAERFARGEIDDDEYQRRLTLLREHRGSR